MPHASGSEVKLVHVHVTSYIHFHLCYEQIFLLDSESNGSCSNLYKPQRPKKTLRARGMSLAPSDSLGPGLIANCNEAAIAPVKDALLVRAQSAQIAIGIVLHTQPQLLENCSLLAQMGITLVWGANSCIQCELS